MGGGQDVGHGDLVEPSFVQQFAGDVEDHLAYVAVVAPGPAVSAGNDVRPPELTMRFILAVGNTSV